MGALLKRLESFCVLLPNETTEDECKELVMEKGLMFLSLLKVALANPKVFCQDLGLCPLNPPPNFAAADGAIPRRAKQPSAWEQPGRPALDSLVFFFKLSFRRCRALYLLKK